MNILKIKSSKKYGFYTATGSKIEFELSENYFGYSVFNCSRNGIEFQIAYSDNLEFVGWHSLSEFCNCPKNKGVENFSTAYLSQNNLTIDKIIEEFEPINLDCYPAWRAIYDPDEIQINYTQTPDNSAATACESNVTSTICSIGE